MFREKFLTDAQKIAYLKVLLGLSVASQVIVLEFLRQTVKLLEEGARKNQELFQITKILLNHTDFADPKLREELSYYKAFLEIAKEEDL